MTTKLKVSISSFDSIETISYTFATDLNSWRIKLHDIDAWFDFDEFNLASQKLLTLYFKRPFLLSSFIKVL